MKTLFKITILLTITITLFSACKKENNHTLPIDNNSFLTAKLDGRYVAFTCKESPSRATFSDFLHIFGQTAVKGNYEMLQIGITVKDLKTLKPGTYVMTTDYPLNIGAVYGIAVNNVFYSSYTANLVSYPSYPLENFTITITAISDSFVAGTFSGTLVEAKSNGTEIIATPLNITDGQFRVPIKSN